MSRLNNLLLLSLPLLLAACATADPSETRAVRADEEYVTGSRLPGKGGRVQTMSKEELERLRSTQQQPLPEGLSPPR